MRVVAWAEEDEDLISVLGEKADLLMGFMLATRPPTGPDGDVTARSQAVSDAGGGPAMGEDTVSIEQFVTAMDRLFLSCDLQLSVWVSAITPVQPSEVGNLVTTNFRSK